MKSAPTPSVVCRNGMRGRTGQWTRPVSDLFFARCEMRDSTDSGRAPRPTLATVNSIARDNVASRLRKATL